MKKLRRILLGCFLIFCVIGLYIPESSSITLYSDLANMNNFPYDVTVSLNG